MKIPEYAFRNECPKCDSLYVGKEFYPANEENEEKEEYLNCNCDMCEYRFTMQTSENMF